MTASWNGGSVDVLCFGFDPDSSALAGLSDDIMQRQLENTREAYENLRRQGYPLSQEPDELSAILATPSGQQTIELADLLEKLGCGTPEKSAWRIVMEAGGCFVANDIALVVESGHRSGAVCLIAHPGRGGANTVFDAGMLDRLRADAPIDGIEAYYPRHTPAQVEMFLEYARKHRLLTSSGSDSHGPDHKPIKYRADLSRALLERVGVRVR
jgi:predicted metal-dependent phosphoesterase TrpH